MPFNLTQKKVLAITPKFTGGLSMVSSFLILKAIRKEVRNRSDGTYQRLLFGMSVFDILGSFSQFLSTWPIPKGSPGVWGAVGNTATCTAQGFLEQMAAAPPLYNASLAVFYLLKGRYKMCDKKLRGIEPILHAIPVGYTLGTAVAGVPLKLFNNSNLWCWIAPFPLDCKDSFRFGAEGNCIRGDNAWIYRIAFQYCAVWASIVIATLSMGLVYWTVLRQERAVDRVQEEGVANRRNSTRVAHQAMLYVLAFYVVWGPPSILRLIQIFPGTNVNMTFPLVLLMVIFFPMQGFFNSVIFFRAKLLKYRRDHPHNSFKQALTCVIFSSKTTTLADSSMHQTVTDITFQNAKKQPH